MLDRESQRHASGVIGIQEGRFKIAADPFGVLARDQRGHDPHPQIQVSHHPLQIIRGYANVAVADDHPIVFGLAVPANHVVYLRVRTDPEISDDQARGRGRMIGDQALDHRNNRVVRVRHGEDDFVIRIIEAKEAGEILKDPAFGALERLKNGDRKKVERSIEMRRRLGNVPKRQPRSPNGQPDSESPREKQHE